MIEWDEGNWPKCGKHGKHGVTQAEIAEVFAGDPVIYADPDHSTAEERLRAIGQTAAGRFVFVAFTLRLTAEGVDVRPISARFMHRKEVARYAKT